jgi:hypothetical protein
MGILMAITDTESKDSAFVVIIDDVVLFVKPVVLFPNISVGFLLSVTTERRLVKAI